MTPRGLAFNEDKTRIVHLERGVRLPGVQRPPLPHGKLLIKPSKAAVRRIRKRLATEMRALRGANAAAVVLRLNPDHPGLGGLLPEVVSSKVFGALDHYMWKLTYRWARR